MIGETNANKIIGEYKCELLTVNVGSDSGDVSGYEITIQKIETVGTDVKYTKLEYIESTGMQYIDTGFKPNQDTRVIAKMHLVKDNANVAANEFFGARTSTSSKAFAVQYNNSTGRLQYFYGNGYTQVDADFPNTISYCDANKNVLMYTTEINRDYTSFQCEYNLYLFALNNAGSVSFQSNARLYSCQIYDNDILIRDYIPVINQDGIAGLYDAVNDTFSVSNSGNNFIAGNNIIAQQIIDTSTYKIPYGITYMISANDVAGFKTPDKQTFIADSVSRTVDVVYEQEILSGVYIQTTDNKYYTSDEWPSITGKTANGVAVFTDNCRFVVAKEDVSSSYIRWGGYGTDISTLTNYRRDTDAATDFDGVNNTSKIIESIGNTNDGYRDGTVAGDCAAYTFPNGKTGYLGAAGEWQAARNNKEALNNALTLIGGTTMKESYYWSSTEYNNNYAWRQDFDYGSKLRSDIKSNSDSVRAFLAI